MPPSPRLAKTTPPSAAGALPRPRLYRLLDRGRARRALWVTGPPGAGKTTLVASYLGRRRLGGLWYQVDGGDADVATFFYYVGRAAPRARHPLPLLTPEYRARLGVFTRRFFQALYGRLRRPFVFVLDNYQEVPADSPLHEVVADGLSELPAGGAVVIVSRSEPPPAFARHRASQTLEILDWDALRLTPGEADAIARARAPRLPPGTRRLLHGQTEGWAAGLVLLLERLRGKGSVAPADVPATHDAVFDYFAGEVLRRADAETRSFLLATAFLGRMTARAAAELTGEPRADRILAGLHLRRYFTERRPGPEPVYAYHALFRAFLREEARAALPPERLAEMQRRAARLLARDGHSEDAVGLLREAGDWDGLRELVLGLAPALLAQGRNQTLAEWVAAFPAAHLDGSAWLLYWLGMARLPFSPAGSRPAFERAFALFREAGDAAGVYPAWAGAVGTTLYEWDAFARLDRWIDVLPAVMREHPSFPSAEVEARVASTMHGALLFRQPGHPEIGAWAARAFALADRITDVNRRMLTGFLLTTYHLWVGDVAKATLVMDTIEPLARSPEASPLAQVTFWTVEAYRAWHQGRAAACLEAVARGLRISHETGVSLWDAQLLSQGVHGALIDGDVARARDFLDRMRAGLARTRVLDAAHYHRLAGWLALLQGDVPASVEHGERSLAMAVEAGAPFSEALSHLALAHALHERREPRRVDEHLEVARRIGREMASRMLEYMSLLAEAHVAFERGDETAGLKALAPAMELGRRQGYVNTPLWRGPVMARLCQRALEAGVEVAYAQDLVRRRRLVPEDPAVTLEAWPWALRVYTLGRFAVAREGAPVRLSSKVQQRPLALLKALIALGGRDVSEEQLAEALWPDAEGDAAHQAFAITLHRLRQLLGSPDAVVLRGGRLSLDPAACWVDAWAFERLLAQAEAAEREGRGERARALTERALALYHGPFLGDEASAAWAVPLRERCRRRFLRRVTRLGQALEAAGEWQAAIDAYERGLEADELAEELYQGLMGCYAKAGRRADGRAVYERCRRVLAATLGVAPSPETEALLRTLRG